MPKSVLEFAWEHGPVDRSKLTSPRMPIDDYCKFRLAKVRSCHDVFLDIVYRGKRGILLIERLEASSQGELWPIGGELLRGLSTEESLAAKVKDECDLDLEQTEVLGFARLLFNTNPGYIGGGDDALAVVYYGRASGIIDLNELHSKPTIITHQSCTPTFLAERHPYVRHFLPMALKKIPTG